MYTDPISDLLTRIRNGYTSHKNMVTVPHSKTKMAILNTMKERRFVHDYKEVKNNKFKEIEITLSQKLSEITLKRISRPGQRIYVKAPSLKKVRGGLGVAILSTPKGIISGEQAKKLNVGGELICELY